VWSGSRSGLVGSLVGFWEASGRVIVHGVRGSCHRRSRFTLYGGGFHGGVFREPGMCMRGGLVWGLVGVSSKVLLNATGSKGWKRKWAATICDINLFHQIMSHHIEDRKTSHMSLAVPWTTLGPIVLLFRAILLCLFGQIPRGSMVF
jgi:hypothetical protein